MINLKFNVIIKKINIILLCSLLSSCIIFSDIKRGYLANKGVPLEDPTKKIYDFTEKRRPILNPVPPIESNKKHPGSSLPMGTFGQQTATQQNKYDSNEKYPGSSLPVGTFEQQDATQQNKYYSDEKYPGSALSMDNIEQEAATQQNNYDSNKKYPQNALSIDNIEQEIKERETNIKDFMFGDSLEKRSKSLEIKEPKLDAMPTQRTLRSSNKLLKERFGVKISDIDVQEEHFDKNLSNTKTSEKNKITTLEKDLDESKVISIPSNLDDNTKVLTKKEAIPFQIPNIRRKPKDIPNQIFLGNDDIINDPSPMSPINLDDLNSKPVNQDSLLKNSSPMKKPIDINEGSSLSNNSNNEFFLKDEASNLSKMKKNSSLNNNINDYVSKNPENITNDEINKAVITNTDQKNIPDFQVKKSFPDNPILIDPSHYDYLNNTDTVLTHHPIPKVHNYQRRRNSTFSKKLRYKRNN